MQNPLHSKQQILKYSERPKTFRLKNRTNFCSIFERSDFRCLGLTEQIGTGFVFDKPNDFVPISVIVQNPNSLGMEHFSECPKSERSDFGRSL